MRRIEISEIKEGMRFTEPVFFDDGKNMFIESEIPVKAHHIEALIKWNIPFLLTDGRVMVDGEVLVKKEEFLEDLEDLDSLEEL